MLVDALRFDSPMGIEGLSHLAGGVPKAVDADTIAPTALGALGLLLPRIEKALLPLRTWPCLFSAVSFWSLWVKRRYIYKSQFPAMPPKLEDGNIMSYQKTTERERCHDGGEYKKGKKKRERKRKKGS